MRPIDCMRHASRYHGEYWFLSRAFLYVFLFHVELANISGWSIIYDQIIHVESIYGIGLGVE